MVPLSALLRLRIPVPGEVLKQLVPMRPAFLSVLALWFWALACFVFILFKAVTTFYPIFEASLIANRLGIQFDKVSKS